MVRLVMPILRRNGQARTTPQKVWNIGESVMGRGCAATLAFFIAFWAIVGIGLLVTIRSMG